ncbi:hypothetical protein RRG08_056497, partial [Elysia crispata]
PMFPNPYIGRLCRAYLSGLFTATLQLSVLRFLPQTNIKDSETSTSGAELVDPTQKTSSSPILMPQATPIEKICGHNSTFNNFVHYVVDVNTSPGGRQYRGAHFIPANEHCKICRLNIETLSTDLYNILRRLDICVTKDQLADWK